MNEGAPPIVGAGPKAVLSWNHTAVCGQMMQQVAGAQALRHGLPRQKADAAIGGNHEGGGHGDATAMRVEQNPGFHGFARRVAQQGEAQA